MLARTALCLIYRWFYSLFKSKDSFYRHYRPWSSCGGTDPDCLKLWHYSL